ncbi:MAG: creatininase family protein [bacterium]
MQQRDYILQETNWKTVGTRASTEMFIAVLPWGATEAHNYHLPYGTDTIQCDYLAAHSAARAREQGAAVMVLPTVPFGVQTGQLDIPFCINLNPSTQAALLRDVAESLAGGGVRSLVVRNGHGGNSFRQIIRELQPQVDVFLCAVDWFRIEPQGEYFKDLGDHAGEMETSVMRHIAGDLVRPLSEAGSGHARRPTITGFREGWAWTPRRWTQVTDDTGVGDPSAATPEKGQRYTEAVIEKLSTLYVELTEHAADNFARFYE